MAVSSFKSWVGRFRQSTQESLLSGFTLLELLVSMLIASLITSGLLFMVVQLLEVNQRESSQTETQREMQMSLDYIASDLQEAVYVYDGVCLTTGPGLPPTDPNFCPGLANGGHIAAPANAVPVLAFWKQEPLPQAVAAQCTGAATSPQIGGEDVPCLSSKSYALIVYYLSTNDPDDIWDGQARITRYALTQFQNGATLTAGYVNPAQSLGFRNWPFGPDPTTGNIVDLQGGTAPGGNVAALVDFVDATDDPTLGTPVAGCSAGYDITPPDNALTGDLAGVRSFYACVRTASTGVGLNQDSIVYIRGNVSGRPGYSSALTFTAPQLLPRLETQVLSRGVLDKQSTE